MTKEMKIALIYWFGFLAVLLVASCKAVQTPPPTSQENSVVKITRNREILDSIKLMVGKVNTGKPECDSVAQATIDRLLGQLALSKSSGNNAVKIDYDRIKKMLNINYSIGETQDRTADRFFKVTQYVPARLTKEQTYSMWIGRILAICLIAWLLMKIGKRFL